MAITKKEMLLREYAEAGLITRQQEELTRRSLHLYLILAPSLFGAIQYLCEKDANFLLTLLLEMAGFFFGLLLLNTVLRSRQYYRVYIDRVKTIEKELKEVQLYSQGNREFQKSGISSLTITNKQSIAWLIALPTAYFFVSAMHHAYCLGEDTFTIAMFVITLALDYYLILVLAATDERGKESLFGEVIVALLFIVIVTWLAISNWGCSRDCILTTAFSRPATPAAEAGRWAPQEESGC